MFWSLFINENRCHGYSGGRFVICWHYWMNRLPVEFPQWINLAGGTWQLQFALSRFICKLANFTLACVEVMISFPCDSAPAWSSPYAVLVCWLVSVIGNITTLARWLLIYDPLWCVWAHFKSYDHGGNDMSSPMGSGNLQTHLCNRQSRLVCMLCLVWYNKIMQSSHGLDAGCRQRA